LYELPDAIREARVTLKDTGGAMRDARVVLKDFGPVLESAGRNFRNLEGFTEVLGQKGDVFAESILRLTSGLDILIRDFNVVVQALNNREGTIGKLIHEPQTYENLNRLMCNTNVVLGNVNDLTKRLQVVVEDVRIFTDKVSREPGRIITGAVNPPSYVK
jgi:phospholipid/cholesterol/gamma-HCH transport system substrate-binding protein